MKRLLNYLLSWLYILPLYLIPRRELHQEIRNSKRWIALRRDSGVVYVPKKHATPEELKQAMTPLELAAWQRRVGKKK